MLLFTFCYQLESKCYFNSVHIPIPSHSLTHTHILSHSLTRIYSIYSATSDEEYDECAEDTPATPSNSSATSNDEDYTDDGCCVRWGGDIEACSINPICNTNQDRCEMLPQCSGNWLSNSDDEPQNSG